MKKLNTELRTFELPIAIGTNIRMTNKNAGLFVRLFAPRTFGSLLFRNFVACCLLLIAYCFTSCSSDSGEKANEATKDSAITVDTSLRGLVGVIEKNPPVQSGDYVAKYPNGIVKMRGYYINGKRNGQWTSFFENGNVQSEGFFKNGLRDGKALVYYENGKVYYEGYYEEGKEVGKWVFYDTSGVKIHEKDYDKPSL